MARLVRKQAESVNPREDYLANTIRMADLAADKKAAGIAAYDVTGMTVLTDALLICSAMSEPQMKAIANNIAKGMKDVGVPALHQEGSNKDGWLVLDFGCTICHIFRQEAREFYDLDGLWGDAPRIDLHLDEDATASA